MGKKIETCANRIKQALEIREMKQSELAEKTGLNKSAISQYCSGRYVPKQIPTDKIAKALDVSITWLMGYDAPFEAYNSSFESQDNKITIAVTREEKDILDLLSKLDAEDKQNLKNYINGVLLAASKYSKKDIHSERKAI